MATTTELRDEVLGHQFSSINYSDRIVRWLDEAQQRVCREAQIPVMRTSEEYTTVAGTPTLTLPADFSKIVHIVIEDTVLYPMSMDDEDTPTMNYVNAATPTGQPSAYYIADGATIFLYPIPDTAYTVTLRYYRLPATLTASGSDPEIPVDYEPILVHYALHRAYMAEHDYEASSYHENQYKELLLKLRGEQHYYERDVPRQVGNPWQGGYYER